MSRFFLGFICLIFLRAPEILLAQSFCPPFIDGCGWSVSSECFGTDYKVIVKASNFNGDLSHTNFPTVQMYACSMTPNGPTVTQTGGNICKVEFDFPQGIPPNLYGTTQTVTITFLCQGNCDPRISTRPEEIAKINNCKACLTNPESGTLVLKFIVPNISPGSSIEFGHKNAPHFGCKGSLSMLIWNNSCMSGSAHRSAQFDIYQLDDQGNESFISSATATKDSMSKIDIELYAGRYRIKMTDQLNNIQSQIVEILSDPCKIQANVTSHNTKGYHCKDGSINVSDVGSEDCDYNSWHLNVYQIQPSKNGITAGVDRSLIFSRDFNKLIKETTVPDLSRGTYDVEIKKNNCNKTLKSVVQIQDPKCSNDNIKYGNPIFEDVFVGGQDINAKSVSVPVVINTDYFKCGASFIITDNKGNSVWWRTLV